METVIGPELCLIHFQILKPFSEMGIRYENSFGGKDYKRNPVGKGIDKVENKSGGKLIPLP